MDKRCFKCGKVKSRSDFYKHSAMADGLLGKCKDCTKKDTINNRNKNHAYYIMYDRDRAKSPHRVEARLKYDRTSMGKLSHIKARSKWLDDEKNEIKKKAHATVHNAVKCGKLKKMPCEICGATQHIHGHHDDYSKPLDVKWLCAKHHRQVHLKEPIPF